MTMHPRVRIALTIVLALLGAPLLRAQGSAPPYLPEPLLRETPWGDFPLERLLPGARLRFTSADGARIERRVVSLGDSTLELLAPAGDSTLHVSFAALRAYRTVEVRAVPRWARRVGPASAVSGVLLGAGLGAIIHNTRKPSSAAVHRPGRLDDIASMASVGGFVGWEIGIQTLGRPRWRRVTLP